jgi:ankyrin repeat protein
LVVYSQVDDDKFNALVESHDLSRMDYHGQTVLHLAAQYCDVKEVQKLINSGAEINAEDFDGFTPIFYSGNHTLPDLYYT